MVMVSSKTGRTARGRRPASDAVPPAESRGRILLADEDVTVRESTALALTAAGFQVVTVSTAAQALAELDAQPTEALLIDIELPGNRDLELLLSLSKEKPLIPVVILTGRPSLDTAVRAVRLGVVDYLAKPPRMPELLERLDLAVQRARVLQSIEAARSFADDLTRRLDALKRVISQGPGASVVAPLAAPSSADPLRNLSREELQRLSRREREVLLELAKGHSTQQMASTLELSTNTIRNHLKSIFAKLGVKSQVALLGKLATPGR